MENVFCKRTNSTLLLFGLIFFSLTGCDAGRNKKDEEVQYQTNQQKITCYLSAHADNSKFNGTALIVKADSIIYTGSFGLANRELQISNTDSTIFLIGSITKPFTALSTLILVDQGKLSLSDPLSKFFPEFVKGNKITISHLLNHTSGLQDYRSFPNWEEEGLSRLTTPMTNIVKLFEAPLLTEPGERFRYCNNGYILLGLIIEKVSQQSFNSFVQREIIDPLMMKNTGVMNNNDDVERLAIGYSSNPRESSVAGYINFSQPFTSGNMYSTSEDLWKFTKGVMSSALLKEETTKQMLSAGTYYGYGWGIRDFNGTKAYGHFGGMNGFVGSITYLPQDSTFVCLLTNDDCTPKVRITQDLISILQGVEVNLPETKLLIPSSNAEFNEIVGDYLVKPFDTLHVFSDSGRLYQQENTQMVHEMFPYKPYHYQFELLEFDAAFDKPLEGKMMSLYFIGSDTILEAKRITPDTDHSNNQ